LEVGTEPCDVICWDASLENAAPVAKSADGSLESCCVRPGTNEGEQEIQATPLEQAETWLEDWRMDSFGFVWGGVRDERWLFPMSAWPLLLAYVATELIDDSLQSLFVGTCLSIYELLFLLLLRPYDDQQDSIGDCHVCLLGLTVTWALVMLQPEGFDSSLNPYVLPQTCLTVAAFLIVAAWHRADYRARYCNRNKE
jgi:hypothetical protein